MAKILKCKEKWVFDGCSIDSRDHGFVELDGIDSGIMAGHAYSIIDVFEVKYNE